MSKDTSEHKFVATDKERDLVAQLSGGGIPQRTICRFVKRFNGAEEEAISLSTLKRHFREELDEGRNIADAALLNKAYELAMAGNPQVVIHMTKVRLGWKEPAQEVHLHTTYGELVKKAAEQPRPEKPALKVVGGTAT